MNTILFSDAIIEDRNGKCFSMWYELVSGRVHTITYTDNSFLQVVRIDLEEKNHS